MAAILGAPGEGGRSAGPDPRRLLPAGDQARLDRRDPRQLWAWYETASRWDGGFSFLGYLDYMIQELVAPLDAAERDALLAEGDKFPFPTRVLVRELAIDEQPGRVRALVVALQTAHRVSPDGTGRRTTCFP